MLSISIKGNNQSMYFIGGAGIEIVFPSQFSINASYTGQYSGTSSSQAFTVGGKFRFNTHYSQTEVLKRVTLVDFMVLLIRFL